MPFLIASFYFFYFAVIAVHIIFMPKVLDMVGYSPSEIGIIFASAPLVRFALPFAFIKGLQLSRPIFNSALAIMALSALAFFPTLHSFWGLLFANIGLGIGLSLILPYIEVVALSHIGKERYGKIRLYGSIGFIAVALVLVKFLSSAEVAIGYLAVTTVLTALFGYLIARHEKRTAHAERTEEDDTSPLQIIGHWPLWVGFALMQVSFGAFYNFFTIYETAHGVSLDMTIYLWTFGVIVEIAMLYFQGPLLRRDLLGLLQFAAAATVLRWMLVYLFPTNLPILFFSQAIHALSFALFHSAAISYLFHLYSQKKLAQQFLSGISYGMGGFIGAVSSGYIYEYWPDQLFLYAALVTLGSFFALRRARCVTRGNC
ncbi:MAG: MFS transporter [Sulfurimonadaceae bacterium]|nr:MFS transporter [Sulfurimonadaceae bacterium]